MTPAVRNEAMFAFTLRASADPAPARNADVDVETIKASGERAVLRKPPGSPASTPTSPSRG